jgi:hypothetical protein
VIDSTGTDSAENPSNPSLPLRRSTRLPFSGYGDSENGIFPVLGADNFAIRGSVSSRAPGPADDADPGIYAVGTSQRPPRTARVQGCWFGLPPGGSTMNDIKAPADAVAAFRSTTAMARSTIQKALSSAPMVTGSTTAVNSTLLRDVTSPSRWNCRTRAFQAITLTSSRTGPTS